MRLYEALTETIKILQAAKIPTGISVQDAYAFARPIMDAINNLNLCVEAIKNTKEPEKGDE